MMSRATAITSAAQTMRSFAFLHRDRSEKNIDAAGDLDQLGHPTDARDHGGIPFLEVDAGAPLARLRPVAFRAPS